MWEFRARVAALVEFVYLVATAGNTVGTVGSGATLAFGNEVSGTRTSLKDFLEPDDASEDADVWLRDPEFRDSTFSAHVSRLPAKTHAASDIVASSGSMRLFELVARLRTSFNNLVFVLCTVRRCPLT